ncbi:MAG: hypothetical protein WC476_06050 [Phycisphaerae bacterium]|jgi:hypothetical protein
MKRNSPIYGFGGTWLIALFFFVLQQAALAGLAVSPLQQWVEVKPGKKATFTITLTNNKRDSQTRPCPVRIEVLDFAVSDKGRLAFGQEYKHPRSAVDWIKFKENEFTLEPGESRKTTATVTVPLDADGDYWAAVMIGQNDSMKDEKGVQVKLRTASGVFIHVTRRKYVERGSIIDANVVIPEFDTVGKPAEKIAAEQTAENLKQNQVLKVEAELKNDGLVAFLARGKAYLYSDNWRRIAAIPLHASRRRVFPGDSRWFTGVMAQPLPAGQYKIRVFLASDSKYERQITKDMEFTISEDLASTWAKNFVAEDTQTLKIEPQQIELKLNPGRLTAANFQVANQGLGTIVANCRIESDKSNNNWIELKTTDFTLAPNGCRSVTSLFRIPSDAKPGPHNWTIYVEAERPGLTTQEQNNTEQHKIPVCVVVDENVHNITVEDENTDEVTNEQEW